MEKIMMNCGHASNSYTDDGRPACVICVCEEVARAPVKLDDRHAVCIYGCGSSRKSDIKLPFFEHRPNEKYDRFYCSCLGWE